MDSLNLAFKPTRLQPLKKLGKLLNIDLWIKRDDLTGDMLSGGNKIRKLEYILKDAKSKGADTILVAGGSQSNLAKTTAALAIQQGIKPILILIGEEPSVKKGNLFLDTIMGVETKFFKVSHPKELELAMSDVAVQLKSEGKNPYIVPFGASNGLGALGYVEAYQELEKQKKKIGLEFDWEFVSAGSGGTYAGIFAGHQIMNASSKLVGISPWLSKEEVKERILHCVNDLLPLIDNPDKIKLDDTELLIEDGFIGEGYSIPTTEGLRAIKLLAMHEGILLDHTYTGKAMSGLIDFVEQGMITSGESVLFWHTGGAPGLFTLEQLW